jgi:hypothetical protein
LICGETHQWGQLVAIFRILNDTELEHSAIDLLSLGKIFWLFFGKPCECLDDSLQNRLLDVTEEGSILECFTRDVQWEIVS